MSYRSLLILLVSLALVSACSDDDDGTAQPNGSTNVVDADAGSDSGGEDPDATTEVDMGPGGPGMLTVEPPVITFEDVRMGETATAEVVLRNLGESNIVITQARVSELDRQGDPEFRATDNWIDGTTIIEPNTFVAIEVEYAPADTEVDRGRVEIFSNDDTLPLATVGLETVNAYPDLEYPGFVRFGPVTTGETATQRVVLYNRGIDPLIVSDISVTQNTDRFQVQFLPTDPVPVSLGKNQQFQFEVVYAPNNEETHRGTLTITSDDPDQGSVEIALTGNNPSPCIATDPPAVNFGEIEAGQAATQEITIFNCGTTLSVNLESIELIDDSVGVFTISNLPQTPTTLPPLQTTTMTVGANIPVPGLRIGTVQIVSDSDNSPLDLEVRATVPEGN